MKINGVLTRYWNRITGKDSGAPKKQSAIADPLSQTGHAEIKPLDIDPADPLIAYLRNSGGVVDISLIHLESQALQNLRSLGSRLIVPLISQEEVLGLISLGPRLSGQEYSSDDKKLLNSLATQASPAFRVAQLILQSQLEAQERERIDNELRVARIIQKTLLPQELPQISHWKVAVHWQPARAVGGDFYDFFEFPDGRIGIVIGDVTDKGVPAALVMASTRSFLRLAAETYVSPSQVLEVVNERLCPDMPSNMFVTCLYAVVDPQVGTFTFANAGHNLPYLRCKEGVLELKATGMPLGLLPGMKYEESESMIVPGNCMILYSDGITEAHNSEGEMFGYPRLKSIMTDAPCSDDLIEYLMYQLSEFTGSEWEQEDDVTFVALEYCLPDWTDISYKSPQTKQIGNIKYEQVACAAFNSNPGGERIVMDWVAETINQARLSEEKFERLKTAVAEAAMNAIEHGNQFDPNKPVDVWIGNGDGSTLIQIIDRGGADELPNVETPDLEAKLAGLQSPRGWGLFLIQQMVDEMSITHEDDLHMVNLIVHPPGGEHDKPAL